MLTCACPIFLSSQKEWHLCTADATDYLFTEASLKEQEPRGYQRESGGRSFHE